MERAMSKDILLCPQCGGELHADKGQIFLTCPYCASTVFLDKSRVVFHWYVAPTFTEEAARGSLARWMAGNQTVKDLDKKSQIISSSFEYFPLWYFKRVDGRGREEIILEPAAATSVSEIRHLRLPAGDLKKYEHSLDPQAQTPTVPLQTALKWMFENDRVAADEVREQAIVHIPLFTFKYIFQGQQYTAIVEAATGEVLANIFPAKAEAPFLLAGGISAVVFLCLATFPVIGGILGNAGGAFTGLLICSGLGIVAAPVLFALAAWVAAKV
jgi:hypothetical protein